MLLYYYDYVTAKCLIVLHFTTLAKIIFNLFFILNFYSDVLHMQELRFCCCCCFQMHSIL